MSSGREVETIRILILDPLPLANLVESAGRPYLKQYVPETIVDDETLRVVYDIHGRQVKLSEITTSGSIVQNNVEKKKELYVPVVGVRIIKDYIDRVLTDNSAWAKQNQEAARGITRTVLKKYLIAEYEHTDAVYELMENLLSELQADIKMFIGNDKWNIHLQRSRGSDILIEKCVDYRVWWYMNNVNGKENEFS